MNPEIVRDLATIVEQATWAHGYGYEKAGHGLDAERGVDLSRSAEEKEAKAERFDIEIGVHAARVAYQGAVAAVAKADLVLVSLVEGTQPAVVRLTAFSSPLELGKAARAAAWRAEHQSVKNPAKIGKVRQVLDKAVRDLSKVMDAGAADGIAHGETLCRTCRIRPRAERKTENGVRVSKAGECDVCAQWRFRNHGPRPVSLDLAELQGPREAKARRLARGEDFGAA